jgi:predicted DCC family thiol-disulfide oxidoreductase YuxK
VSAPPVLLYDGTCGFCAESVQVILRHDRRGALRFASLQGEFGAGVRARHPEVAGVDSMMWVDAPGSEQAERVFVRSAAGLRVAAYLGGIWRAALLGWLLPRPLRDGLYDFVARHRHRLASAPDSCLVPPPQVRDRFLP